MSGDGVDRTSNWNTRLRVVLFAAENRDSLRIEAGGVARGVPL